MVILLWTKRSESVWVASYCLIMRLFDVKFEVYKNSDAIENSQLIDPEGTGSGIKNRRVTCPVEGLNEQNSLFNISPQFLTSSFPSDEILIENGGEK
ncbi:MAG: hypothetical protein Q8M08_03010 [Bacteroidales bacterium]|nr:hypothetical protein [Bacteroidales bacterium]